MASYDHKRIEQKWQKIWEDRQMFKCEIDPKKPKYYILDMFPYPSGAGLHVGHVTGYTATDILARYKRQKGFNVLHPMGWDSFGLPAEQYAIRTGQHPAVTTEKNINTYRRQLKSLGFSYDWSREVATSDPKYYKWTQWIFTKLYEKGLAYEAEVLVNYCPALGTVLANEEVENGKAKEGGYPVIRKPLRQWMLKITAYAERLLKDLDLLDWPDYLKRLQTNWIGKSVGAKIFFTEVNTDETISIFTTRPDTLFGATYLVLAPEHSLVDLIVSPEKRREVEVYKKVVAEKSDLERTELAKEKTGVWTGTFAINPGNEEKIPIWIADYVLASYGTGAIMAVPNHDERDLEFARQFDLPIRAVVDPSYEAISALELGQSPEDVRLEVLSGKRCWIGEGKIIQSENKKKNFTLNGTLSNEAKEKITAWLEKIGKGERSVNYKLRDWLFSRQRYWGEPFPILHFQDGTKRVLDADELPLCPPDLIDFTPNEKGEAPLAKVKNWVEITDPKTGKKARRETNTMPQWAGSCWYYLRFCDPMNENEAWDKKKERYWMAVDMYVGGVEHAVLHLLYARFWHKVLYDLEYVTTEEPFQTLRNQGLLTARSYKLPKGGYVAEEEVYEENGEYFQKGTRQKLLSQIEKMSKSKLNGVSPDDMIEDFGADALRLYEMFMGPFEKEKIWSTDAVNGCRRFLNRFYEMVFSSKVTEEVNETALKLGHRLISQVEKDLESMQFNTAIAKMMEFLNDFLPLPTYPKKVVQMAVQALYPFAPHFAEEAWHHLGGKESLTYLPFPRANPKYLIEQETTYVVQVNGRLRGKWDFPKGISQEELYSFIKDQPQISKYLIGEIDKIIFVPEKLINIVIKT
ncbi:MAG: leucine--tRNA ligase [Chlamydiae bacterium]|nr:leucine--tRNA ligase [Chlamydiota bacterium]